MKKRVGKAVEQSISFEQNDFKIIARDNAKLSVQDKAFHEEIEIKYFYEGKGTLLIDNKLINAEAGDITIANPYEIHANVDVSGVSGKYYSLILNLNFFNQANGNANLQSPLIFQGVKFNNLIRGEKRLSQIVKRVVEEMRDKREYYRLVVFSLLNELFILLLRDYVNKKGGEQTLQKNMKGAEVIAPALVEIFNNYKKRITVDELAELCCLSKYYFCRAFKKEMGMTVIQYITQYRISIAETMLNSTEKTISEIASQCGFEDESYFYRCYKKIKGTTPKFVRKTIQKD